MDYVPNTSIISTSNTTLFSRDALKIITMAHLTPEDIVSHPAYSPVCIHLGPGYIKALLQINPTSFPTLYAVSNYLLHPTGVPCAAMCYGKWFLEMKLGYITVDPFGLSATSLRKITAVVNGACVDYEQQCVFHIIPQFDPHSVVSINVPVRDAHNYYVTAFSKKYNIPVKTFQYPLIPFHYRSKY